MSELDPTTTAGKAVSQLTLILGGARSGKSTYAQAWAEGLAGERVLFVATAEAGDEEMQERISRHRELRPAAWRTLEAPTRVGEALRASWKGEPAVILDCLTLLVANTLAAYPEPASAAARAGVLEEVEGLLDALRDLETHALIVSNEVGLGLVPPNPLGRAYRDLLGEANQLIARRADAVIFMVAGIPMRIKG
ncbi:MAG: bifunctional adenosylcobinamide kinase/adenosylcobinamide-phosphate guanylyltransferase [Caldilineae bacterium]|nr:MAG: bifunctional adenosylcobinamide kinase/adenosylcobinamide-phosphate guanylyltransferase [Caldilineae bacterium]